MAALVLEAVAAYTTTWVGSTVDRAVAAPGCDGVAPVGVPLRDDEVARYYDGCANQTLWPLYHDLAVTPRYEPRWWDTYRSVNARFARAIAATAAPGAVAWLHDDHRSSCPACSAALVPTSASACSCTCRSPHPASSPNSRGGPSWSRASPLRRSSGCRTGPRRGTYAGCGPASVAPAPPRLRGC